MYRVGFGDCFLFSFPTGGKQHHVLIDCGAHFADLHIIPQVVDDIAKETDRQLAVVVASHIHKDHVSGFAKCQEEFSAFKVGEVWLPWTANGADAKARHLWAKQEALVSQLRLSLRAAGNKTEIEAILDNFPSRADYSAATEGMKNRPALEVLLNGFRPLEGGKGSTPVRYLAARPGGGPLRLPTFLAGITVNLLAPSRSPNFIAMLDPPKEHHYLAARFGAAGKQADQQERLMPFTEEWRVPAARYLMNCWPPDLKESLSNILPDDVAGLARWLEDALNNTSLVIHFSVEGKNLLFSGDAQWGSWLSWMYERSETARGLTTRSRDLIADLDFIKIAHHGSVNATPRDLVANLPARAAVMCSTNGTTSYPHVPLPALIDALDAKTGKRLALSDQIDIAGNERAHRDLRNRPLPRCYTPGPFWIDYHF